MARVGAQGHRGASAGFLGAQRQRRARAASDWAQVPPSGFTCGPWAGSQRQYLFALAYRPVSVPDYDDSTPPTACHCRPPRPLSQPVPDA